MPAGSKEGVLSGGLASLEERRARRDALMGEKPRTLRGWATSLSIGALTSSAAVSFFGSRPASLSIHLSTSLRT